jgi:hypothetical protein
MKILTIATHVEASRLHLEEKHGTLPHLYLQKHLRGSYFFDASSYLWPSHTKTILWQFVGGPCCNAFQFPNE